MSSGQNSYCCDVCCENTVKLEMKTGGNAFTTAVLIFFIAGLLYLLRFKASMTWERTASRRRPAFSSHLIATVIARLRRGV
jgi:hypothetical protein